MIWLWITLALVLSFIPLINKKINLAYYVWLLIPIDAYGVVVAGATIKPYMIFALLLPIILYAQKKGTDFDLSASKGQLFACVISLLIIVVNLVNNNDFSTVKAAFMTFVVYVCAQLCVSCTDKESFDKLSDIFIAACFGFSIVFLFAHICVQNGLILDGFIAQQRTDVGMFMKSSNVVNGAYTETYRLRGFAFDPNTMFPQFIFGITACVLKLIKKFKLYYIVTIILSVFCVILSSSRMGLICIAVSVAIAFIIAIAQLDSVRKKVVGIVGVISVCVAFLCFTVTRYGQALMSSIFSTYSNRSSLTDEYGRFSIWKECLSVYWEKNPLLGVGYSRMDELTATQRMTHNTWLQFICECGIIVGSIAIIYFIGIMIVGFIKMNKSRFEQSSYTSYICLVIGYAVTIISLTSVDNLTCSYLWFSALLILKMLSCTQVADKPNDNVEYTKT